MGEIDIVWKRPAPNGGPIEQPFWDLARQGKLGVQHCTNCGDTHFPPTPICPKCLHDEQQWQVASGRATLESWTAFHKAYWPDLLPETPYNVCLVRLAEGPLMISNLIDAPAELRLGMALEVRFVACEGGFSLPVFTPERVTSGIAQ